MYLSEVYAENFRLFGQEAEGKHLQLALRQGLNVLVGENDGGKSAVIDAIRYCLLTTSQDHFWLTSDDFHCDATSRRETLRIRCKFSSLSIDDQATFMEWLTTPEGQESCLYVHVRASLLTGKKKGRVAVSVHAGIDGEGAVIEGTVRELLKTTYLRPLRDAESELSPGRNSRLSQILSGHPEILEQEANDFDPAVDGSGKTLVGIMKRAEHAIGSNTAIQAANDRINSGYLKDFRIGSDSLASEVGVVADTTLNRILEKLELSIARSPYCSERTRRGLGYNNALFMSAELLLLGSREAYPTLLIEEPEAHLHPQMQASVISLLRGRTDVQEGLDNKPVQVILTTHSPYLASSVPLANITIVSAGGTYSLGKDYTKLSSDDYAFLERFLDSTKANLFFARGVAIVEGDAENLLLPVLAEKVGYSFRENGLSVVNVGHTGLFRYSNIFRRRDARPLPIRVACLRDRDIVPDSASDELKRKLKREKEYDDASLQARNAKLRANDGESVKTFVSDRWTFEFDLAVSSWKMAKVMMRSVHCASATESSWPDEAALTDLIAAADNKFKQLQGEGKAIEEVALTIFAPLRTNQVSKTISAQFAARFVMDESIDESHLPGYIIEALQYLCDVPSH